MGKGKGGELMGGGRLAWHVHGLAVRHVFVRLWQRQCLSSPAWTTTMQHPPTPSIEPPTCETNVSCRRPCLLPASNANPTADVYQPNYTRSNSTHQHPTT